MTNQPGPRIGNYKNGEEGIYLKKGRFIRIMNILAIAGWLMVVPATVTRAVPSITATIDSNRIAVGATAELTITVNDASHSRPEIPDIKGLRVENAGKSTQVRIVNGQFSSSNTYTYVITALSPGNYKLGPFSIRAGNKTITTNAITLTVDGSNAAGNNIPAATSSSKLGDRLFLEVDLPRRRIFLGEKIPINIRLYIRDDVQISDVTYPSLNQPMVSLEQMGKPAQSNRIVNGISYEVVDFATTLSGVKTGKVNLGPFTLNCNMLSRQRSGDSLIDEFFSDYEKEPVRLSSNQVALEILPLPLTGQPADFSGGIGHFKVNASGGPQDVSQGDPITVKLTVSGEGNLNNIAAPQLVNSSGFKVYDAQRKSSENGQTVFEQVLIPLETTVKQVGPYVLTYFDTAAGSYQKALTGAIPINVKPNPNFKSDDFVDATLPASGEQLGKDIVFIKPVPGRLQLIHHPLRRQVWFWLLQFVPLLGLAGAIVFRQYRRSLRADTPKARALRAYTQAFRGISKCRNLLAHSQAPEVLEQLHTTFRGYFGMKYNLSPAGMTGTVTEELAGLNRPGELLQQIRDFFDRYDFYRFTGAKLGQDDVARLIDLAEQIIRSDNAVPVFTDSKTVAVRPEGGDFSERR
jgi:hypothetical protein